MTTTTRFKGIEQFLDHFKDVKPYHDGWMSLCPGHDDRDRSLKITPTADGKILLHCFAGCANDHICKSVGLTLSDLFLDKDKQGKITTAYYSYEDAERNLIYQVCRTLPKGFYQRRPDGKGGFIYDLKGITPTIYHLPDILTAIASGEPIIVVPEGEKDVDNCFLQFGIPATCNSGGAGKWRSGYGDYFKGAQTVVVVADRDSAGRDHARQVAESLIGRVKTLKIIEMPGDDVKDLSDWIEKGGGREAFINLISQASEYKQPKKELSGRTRAIKQENALSDDVLRDEESFTDSGNADRLVDEWRQMIRYCFVRKMWLIYNGRFWEWNDSQTIQTLAQKTVRELFNEAAAEPDRNRAASLSKHAVKSLSEARISSMVALAQKDVAIKLNALDANEWLLNVKNGTINLKTGELQPFNPDDFITRQIDVEFIPSAHSAEWVKFLNRIFEEKQELIAYIQRALGYSITGNQGEQAIFLCQGSGWNGKSTLLGAIRMVLGEYATEVDPAAFMVDKHRGTGPNEAIASLYKVNFCNSTEIEDGQSLATSLLKRMTGGESLRCERKFEHGFNFKPQYKLWLCGNHEPSVGDTTDSIWHRIKKIPFNTKRGAEERIKNYDSVLSSQYGSAILAWLVQGCLDWRKQGLGEPPEVTEATQAYRDSQDGLHDFLTENWLIKGSESIQVAALYKAYQDWSSENGDKYFIGKGKFNTRMVERGFVKVRGNENKLVWRGVRLYTLDEKVTSVTSVIENDHKSICENLTGELRAKQVTEVTKVTLSDVEQENLPEDNNEQPNF